MCCLSEWFTAGSDLCWEKHLSGALDPALAVILGLRIWPLLGSPAHKLTIIRINPITYISSILMWATNFTCDKFFLLIICLVRGRGHLKHVRARVCLVYNGPAYLLVDPSGDLSCQPIRARLLPGLTNQSAGLMSHNWWLFIDPNSALKAHWEGDKVAQDGDKVSFGMQLFHVLGAMYILASSLMKSYDLDRDLAFGLRLVNWAPRMTCTSHQN